jgi:hypothetical protein
MTWFWAEGRLVVVETSSSGMLPVAFMWWEVRHPVAGILNRWRVDTGWWEERLWRDYFRLYTANPGLLVVLFHDLVTDLWYMERMYD